MFERESKREKILEARNRELRLKMKTKSAQQLGAESEAELKEKEASQISFGSDPEVVAAEAEFFRVIDVELKGFDPNAKGVLFSSKPFLNSSRIIYNVFIIILLQKIK